ncbi:uncharacterized protein PG998_004948 [Apiospora kogelbergensis]|uniref:uncharacterized protein n=1 Tax=Apiospora kogelbergensis TaxID=1337665 RepID=UPI00312F12CF
MEGTITASRRIEDLGDLARQRPETEEATWRLLGALSFLSPVHALPPIIFQPTSSSSSISTIGLPWLLVEATREAPIENRDGDGDNEQQKKDDVAVIGGRKSVVRNLYEDALQPLLETGIVRRAYVRGPIVHIDHDTQKLYRGLTVKRHGQRDFDLAVRMLLQPMPMPTSISTMPPSSSSSSGSVSSADVAQDSLAHHALGLVLYYEHYAAWNNDDDEVVGSITKIKTEIIEKFGSSSSINGKSKTELADMFVQRRCFVPTRDLEELVKRTLDFSGYLEHEQPAMTC